MAAVMRRQRDDGNAHLIGAGAGRDGRGGAAEPLKQHSAVLVKPTHFQGCRAETRPPADTPANKSASDLLSASSLPLAVALNTAAAP